MAQDWYAAIGFFADSLTIDSGDLDGVNLAGIQVLDRRDQRQQEEIEALRAETAALRTELAPQSEAATQQRAELMGRLERLERRREP